MIQGSADVVWSISAEAAPTVTVTVTHLLQFAEIIFITYEQDYKLAGLLTFFTISSCFISVYKLYQSRMGLYQSVSQQRLVAIVQAGRVR